MPTSASWRTNPAATALLCLALAFAVKGLAIGGALVLWGGLPVATDTRTIYRPMALGLLAGDGYQLGGDPRAATRIPPLTPLFLAGLYALFGPDPHELLLPMVGALLRAATTALAYTLGLRLLGPPAALGAALVYAVDPWEVLWSVVVLKDSLALPLFVSAILTFQIALDRPSWPRALLAGVLLGLASLARHAALGFAGPALAVCLIHARSGRLTARGAVRVGVGLLAGVTLLLAPLLIHNWRVLGEIAISSHYVGRAFYVGNAPGAEASGSGYAGDALPDPALIRQVEQAGGPLHAGEVRLLWGGLEPLLRQPSRVLELSYAKLVSLWRPTFRGASLRNWLFLGVPYLVFMTLALLGVLLTRDRAMDLLVPCVALGYLLATSLILYSEIRQRQYFVPFLALFAGTGLVHAIARIRSMRS